MRIGLSIRPSKCSTPIMAYQKEAFIADKIPRQAIKLRSKLFKLERLQALWFGGQIDSRTVHSNTAEMPLQSAHLMMKGKPEQRKTVVKDYQRTFTNLDVMKNNTIHLKIGILGAINEFASSGWCGGKWSFVGHK